MKYFKISSQLFLVIGMMVLALSSCKKPTQFKPIGDAGQTLVKILNGSTPYGIVKKPIDFVNTPTQILAVDLRRDVPNEAELNKTMTVTIKDDTTAVSFFNRDTVSTNPNRTNPGKLFYTHLPTAWYTIQGDGVKTGGQGGTYTITFKPGEFAKVIYITIPNATLLNPSALYALGFTIVSADAGGIISTQKTVLLEVGAKNIYDGVYSVESGNVQRYTAGVPEAPGGLNGSLAGNPDIYLITTGAYTVAIPPVSTAGGLFWAFGSNSMVAGVDGIRLTVDPVTNLVTAMSAGNATFANWVGKPNYYDPATKTFYLSWRWNPTGNTREYEVVLKYKMPR